MAAPEDLLDLDEALAMLAGEDPAKAELVKLRFVAGLSVEEAAPVLGISRATADRHWHYARVWSLSQGNQAVCLPRRPIFAGGTRSRSPCDRLRVWLDCELGGEDDRPGHLGKIPCP